MFDEVKVQKDLEKMRKTYEGALKELKDVEARQEEIARKIYAICDRNKNVKKHDKY